MSPIDRPLSGEVLRFDLAEEHARVVADAALLERSGRIARTLIKDGSLRVTLVAVRAGGRIEPHVSGNPITLHVLDGDIRCHVAGKEHALRSGQLLAVPAGVEHDVTSQDGGAFLLTVAHAPR